MKKLTSALLLASMLLSMLVSCGSSGDTSAETTAQNSGETTAVQQSENAEDSEISDSLPDLDFKGETIKVLYRNVHNLPDYEMTAEQTGDIIDDAVYKRNLEVAERLNVKFDFVGMGDAAAAVFPTSVLATVTAGEDEFDFFVWGQTQSLKNILNEVLMDMSDAIYFDFDKPWWNVPYMDEMRIGNDNLFFLSGDLVLTVISRMSTVFVNKTRYEELHGDMNKLYSTVLDGNFTHEKFRQLTENAYSDVNGNGTADLEDRYGVMATTVSETDHFAYTAGLTITKRDKDGYPEFCLMSERNSDILDTIKSLYYNNPGFFIEPTNDIIDGTAEKRFASGQMIFLPLWFAATERLRDMEGDYGLVPFPKMDDAQDNYRSLVQNTASVISVPITVGNKDMVSAVLEALSSVTHRDVLPAYYEVGLKTKYSRDNASSQMVDLIYSVASTDFGYAYSSSLSSIGTIARTVVGTNKDFASTYASKEATAIAALDKLNALY